MVLASMMRPSAIIASASSIESSSTSMSSPSSASAAAGADLHLGLVFGDEEMQLLGHRARAHEGLEHLADVVQAIAGFLLGLGADPVLGRFVVEQAGGGLDQEIVVAVDIGRIAELLDQHDGAPRADCRAAASRRCRGHRSRGAGSAIRRRRAATRRSWSSAW